MADSSGVMDPLKVPLGTLEQLAKEGWFMQQPRQYLEAVEGFVRVARLDALEVVVPAGNVKKVQPLHLAAKYGQIDVVELFVSAGFNPLNPDREGKTPLHWCATNRSSESALVATFLALVAPAAHAMRDKDGNAPLHLACKRSNEKVFAALLSQGGNPKMPDATGKNVRQIAKIQQLTRIQAVLEGDVSMWPGSGSRTGAGAGALSSSAKKGCSKSQQDKDNVDMGRTMLIWERFFENAFKAMGGEMDEMDQGLGLGGQEGFMMDSEGVAAAVSGAKASTRPSPHTDLVSAFDLLGVEGFFDADEPSATPTPQFAVDIRVRAWLQWVLCYSAEGHYFVVNSGTGESEWLEVHLERQRKKHRLYRGPDINSSSPDTMRDPVQLPRSAHDLVRDGWLSFFDGDSNRAYWMHLSGQCELVLPVGDADPTMKSLGFPAWEGSSQWVSANKTPCALWCIVMLGEDERAAKASGRSLARMASQGWFFSNTLTGHTAWAEPDDWAAHVESAGGWALCRNEDDLGYFWWHTATGDVSWAEEEE
jgi:hypothetical protein